MILPKDDKTINVECSCDSGFKYGARALGAARSCVSVSRKVSNAMHATCAATLIKHDASKKNRNALTLQQTFRKQCKYTDADLSH